MRKISLTVFEEGNGAQRRIVFASTATPSAHYGAITMPTAEWDDFVAEHPSLQSNILQGGKIKSATSAAAHPE